MSGIACLCVFSGFALTTAQDVGQVDLVFIDSATLDAPIVALALPSAAQLVALTGTQAGVYDILTSGLRFRSTIPLDGEANLLAAGSGYVLTSADTPDGEFLTTIAPSPYNPRRGWEAIGLLQLPATPVSLATGQTWGTIGFSDGYMALEIVSSEAINHRLIETNEAVFRAAVFRDTAFLALADEPALRQIAFATGPSVTDVQSVPLESPVRDLVISEVHSLGAALLASGAVVLFDPASATLTGSFMSTDAADTLLFTETDDGTPHLLLSAHDSTTIQIVNLSDAANPVIVSTIDLPRSLSGIAAFESHIVIADPDAITLYRLTG